MSKNSSAQNIPQEATKLKKLAKTAARYMEMEEFKDSDHHTGYFCYNCMYFIKPNHCAIVTDEYARYGNRIKTKYMVVLVMENQMSLPQMFLPPSHARYVMRNLTQEKS